MNKTQIVAFATNALKGHTIELCDGIGNSLGMATDAGKLADEILNSKDDSYLSFKRINSDMFLGGVGITKNSDGTVSFRYFSRGIEHLDPKDPSYQAA